MSNKELQQQMASFEAARIAEPVQIEPPKVGRVVAVHDGTDQDPIVDAVAAGLVRRTGAQAASLPAPADGDEALAAMLAAARTGDILVVPSPFRRDYASEGRHSLSTTIDLLLARSEATVCVVRGPLPDADACLGRPVVGLQIDRHRKVAATALAVAIARGGGELLLVSSVDPHGAVADQELLARNLDPRDLSPEVLAGLATARAAALTAALQRRAGEWQIEPRVVFAVGDTVELMIEHNRERHGLLVAGRERDARRSEAQNARRLILASEWPVLLV